MSARTSALYEAALAADDAWHAELTRAYGKRASDYRYKAKYNRATPELARLHDAFAIARDAWQAEMRRASGQIKLMQSAAKYIPGDRK